MPTEGRTRKHSCSLICGAAASSTVKRVADSTVAAREAFMATKSYSIPSLFSDSTWKLVFTNDAASWKQLYEPWKKDGLLSKKPADHAIRVGQTELMNELDGRFRFKIAQPVTLRQTSAGAGDSLPSSFDVWRTIGWRSQRLAYGIYKTPKGRHSWLQLTPWAENLDDGDDLNLPGPTGLAPITVSAPFWWFRSISFFHKLEESEKPGEPWYALTRTETYQGQPHTANRTLDPAQAFSALNHLLRETRGTQAASNPFHGLVPAFRPVDADFDPLTLYALKKAASDSWQTSLRRIDLGEFAAGKQLYADIDWFYPDRDDGHDHATSLNLKGTIDPDYNAAQFKSKWGAVGDVTQATFESMLTAWRQLGAPIAQFKLKNCAVHGTPRWIRMGSVEILPKPSKSCTLDFEVNGHAGTTASDVYPVCNLYGLECYVRHAAGADSPRESASLDRYSEVEEVLRRESTPIVSKIDEQAVRKGKLSMRTRYEPGRDATTEIRIVIEGADQELNSSAIWLNLRPFLAARVDFPRADTAQTTLIWRSDDKDGAQWRVENQRVTVVLPPQAVGEEMERGDRFYDNPVAPDIAASAPVPYRFSRGTYLTLRPSAAAENRRFEKSPLNFGQLIKSAYVERMVVEMAYPLEATYTRRDDSSRTVMLTEAGAFFGKPSENLPDTQTELSQAPILSEALAHYVQTLPEVDRQAYLSATSQIVARQTAVHINFSSRLAELYVHDPVRPREDLQLGGDELLVRLRHTDQGAMPIMDPLPRGSAFQPDSRAGEFSKFVKNGAWGQPSEGSIRAGLVHSFELPSELVEVLETPQAVSGVIEALTLSALGATGRMQASFAKGKTSFAIVAEHGQLSRLVKTRIGRIGALWNRAKHVIVYERTAARSAQFKTEQGATDAFNRWPILRKTEEYIEPIQVERDFHEEDQKESNTTRFIKAAVFATRRIYVNGAWARDLGDGYEMPLWDHTAADSDPQFYPKPKIFLSCFGAGDKLTRLWFRDPARIFFFTSTADSTDADTDKWKPKSGVDFDNLPRLPVLERAPSNQGGLTPRKAANRDLCTSFRFDLAVDSEGPVNLQHGVSSKPMLVVLDRVSVSRTSQLEPVNIEKVPELKPAIAAMEITAVAQHSADRLVPSLENLGNELQDLIERELYKAAGQTDPCGAIAGELKSRVTAAIKEFAGHLDPSALLQVDAQILRTQAMWLSAADELIAHLSTTSVMAQEILKARTKSLLTGIEELLAAIPDSDAPLPAAVLAQRTAFLGEIEGLRLDLSQRVDRYLRETVAQVSGALAFAVAQADAAAQDLADAGKDFASRCESANAKIAHALAALEKLPASSRRLLDSAGNWLRYLSKQLTALAGSAAYLQAMAPTVVEDVSAALSTLSAIVSDVAKKLSVWSAAELANAAATTGAVVDGITAALLTHYQAIGASTTCRDLRATLTGMREIVANGSGTLVTQHEVAVRTLQTTLRVAADRIAASMADPALNPLKAVADKFSTLSNQVARVPAKVEVELHRIIDDGAAQCDQLVGKLRKELKKAEDWAREQARAVITDVLSDEATQQLAQYAATAQQVWDVGSRSVSLARAVGDLPNVLPLRFDIDIAAYAFSGGKLEVQMSPAIARLGEAGEAVLESLGLSLPGHELTDRFMTDFSGGLMFNDVINKYAGLDFSDMVPTFPLPQLNSENIKITHGFDKETRRAWVNADVDFSHMPYEELFSFGPVELGLENMEFDAFTGIETHFIGNTPQTPVSKTRASLKADWLLQGGGQPLVKFKQVTIKFDGASGFDFDVSPDNIELHPSLKFISEFVEQFKGELPPAIQLEEENGRPVGVSAGTTIVLDDLPDLGAVTIGPIDMRSSLGLRLESGRFVVSSAFSVGNKQKPIFVQITWLGGGCWLEARAKYVDGVVHPSMSVGLSVGATRAFNLAGVAKGSFSVMIFCYIEIQRDDQSIAVGLAVNGSALIIGFVNASLSLLLEAKHSKGKTEGTGRLDVSVKISWFYTFRHKQTVNHKF